MSTPQQMRSQQMRSLLHKVALWSGNLLILLAIFCFLLPQSDLTQALSTRLALLMPGGSRTVEALDQFGGVVDSPLADLRAPTDVPASAPADSATDVLAPAPPITELRIPQIRLDAPVVPSQLVDGPQGVTWE